MGILDHDEILKLHRAVISAQIVASRSTLLVGIDDHVVAGLPYAANPSDQILEDLHAMNETGALADGSVPLATWLQNAVARAGAKKEGAVFQNALDRARSEAIMLAGAAKTEARASPVTPGAPTIDRLIRSTLDAADPAVVAPLGLLAREYIDGRKSPDAFFRGFTQLLSQVSGDDYRALQSLMRNINTSVLPDDELRVIVREGKNFKQGFGFYIWKDRGEQQGMYFAGTSKDPGYLLHLLKVNRFARAVTGMIGDTGGDDVFISRSTAARFCEFIV